MIMQRMIKPSSISVCFQSNPSLRTQGNATKKIPTNPIPSRANKEKINTFSFIKHRAPISSFFSVRLMAKRMLAGLSL